MRLLAQREREKAVKKENDAQVRVAQQVLGKISATLKSGIAAQAKDAYSTIAHVIRDPIDDIVKVIADAEASATEVINLGAGDIKWDVKTAAVKAAELKRHVIVASGTLATIAKASSNR